MKPGKPYLALLLQRLAGPGKPVNVGPGQGPGVISAEAVIS
jgi:hypothetical protein